MFRQFVSIVHERTNPFVSLLWVFPTVKIVSFIIVEEEKGDELELLVSKLKNAEKKKGKTNYNLTSWIIWITLLM